jgi:hypothetical protein
MKIVTATVKQAPRQVTTRYGDRIVFDVTFADGLEETIWNPAERAHLLSFKEGDAIEMGIDSKGKAHVIEPEQPTSLKTWQPKDQQMAAAAPQANDEPDEFMPPQQKQAIATYVEQMGDLYAFCFQVAKTKLDGKTDNPETIRVCSSSIFIAAQRRFGLN